ncbi:MAG: glucose 1-dehydrogenase [Deltaproteobacteria bacterium]|jgi:3alpha(or 20beta)-hydroxysteroid dehydrogenase|nr:glucose 1-dehydrogenase [Deltaproteobacteria bacterium]MBW2499406.1 glucose 1-dehydrogenase [Deltaproteobacteria bacterium]
MTRRRLEGRIALITGAARGQGAAEARLFAEEGARVVVTDVLEDELDRLAAEIGDAALAHPLDVSDESQWKHCLAEVESRFDSLDVLINNAGIARGAPLLETSLEDYMDVIRVNQVGCFLGLRLGGSLMARTGGGSIVNVSSTGGLEGVPQMVGYAASKHAITGMTRTAAIELGAHGIRVNSLHPGGVDTDMLGPPEARRAVDYSWLPLGRLADPDEIARAALFLASDESSYCTGTALLVDGGTMSGPLGWSPPEQE